ncbi:MAG: biotin--[acetyl-CoA-carboxylase] ligase, partial [Bacteroidota bacterium]|nr:biotin--[acetyl-CoA-carboxylase] ligase [Bacteroidota bacterium]
AMATAQKGAAKHGEAWFAHRQTAGKGSRGKSWNSSSGDNIILSVLLQPDSIILSSQSFYITSTIALAAYDLFKRYAVDNVSIKWTNDIYWNDRKAGGILIENNFRGSQWKWCVAGIGMNINQIHFDASLPNPVSLKQITGKTYDVVTLAKELCDCLQQRYEQLQRNKESILANYNDVLYQRNQTVKLKKGNVVFTGIIERVTASGLLEVENGLQSQFAFGEVEWVLPKQDVI